MNAGINDVKSMLHVQLPAGYEDAKLATRAFPDEPDPATAERTTDSSLEWFYSHWSGVIVVDHLYTFTAGYKAEVHMAESDNTIKRFEIACLANYPDCVKLTAGGKFKIEKMRKGDPDLYPVMKDDYNLGSVRITGSEESAVYFVVNQDSPAARSDKAEETRHDEAEPSNHTSSAAPRSPGPDNSSLEFGQIFKMAVASSNDLGNRYLIVFFTPGKPESTAKATCLKKYPDCRQLTAGHGLSWNRARSRATLHPLTSRPKSYDRLRHAI
jgi:hypothetical protein